MNIITRRGFLGTAAAWMAQPTLAAKQDSLKTISIFHTTDLHGNILPTTDYDGKKDLGGLARCATQIRQWRKESPHNLTVDIGDVYQGTPAGWMTKGRIMIDLLNQIGYDSWTIGNHEFDWGPEVLLDVVGASKMPVLSSNLLLEGKKSGSFSEKNNPLSSILPHTIKTVAGIKIGIIGLTTPGLPYWLPNKLLKGFEAFDPIKSVQDSVTYLRKEAKADIVIVCGHMGYRSRDDFANPVNELLKKSSGIDLYLGGHSHRNHPSREVSKVPYTQANYFGIHCGRADLVFDQDSKKIVAVDTSTHLMDNTVALDPVVLDRSASTLTDSKKYQSQVVGSVKDDIPNETSTPNKGTPLQKLICETLLHAASAEDIPVDVVLHGTFGSETLTKGPKKISDLWEVIPYENELTVFTLSREELLVIVNEMLLDGSDRRPYGVDLNIVKGENRWEPDGKSLLFATGFTKPDGSPDDRSKYRVLLNAYDAQSAGRRLLRLRAIAENKKKKLLKKNSRTALIDFFASKESIGLADLRHP